jgi:Spy/CpxP family protein refolding chaperone
MKNGIKRTVICSVAAAMLLAAPRVFARPSYAHEGGGEGRGERAAGREKFAEELGLTQEQKDAMKAQREQSRAKMKETREKLRDSQKALHEELQKPETDSAAIDNIVYRIKEAQGELIDQRVESFLSMKKILTPEQFQKMGGLGETRKKEWMEKKGRKDPGEKKSRGGF